METASTRRRRPRRPRASRRPQPWSRAHEQSTTQAAPETHAGRRRLGHAGATGAGRTAALTTGVDVPPPASGFGELPAEIPGRGDIPPAIGNRRSQLCSFSADLGLFESLRPCTEYHVQLRWQQPCLRRNRNQGCRDLRTERGRGRALAHYTSPTRPGHAGITGTL